MVTRMWINQPSTLQAHHELHGTLVLAERDYDSTWRVFFLAGDIVSQQLPADALSGGWPAHLRTAPEVPNLDGMTHDDLMAFWKRYHRASRKDAVALVGPRKGFTVLAAKLANYACNKAVAMTCREKGDILAASNYEAYADRIYDELPEDCKW